MTIDERLEALSQHVEVMSGMQIETEKKIDILAGMQVETAKQIQALTQSHAETDKVMRRMGKLVMLIGLNHESRISNLELGLFGEEK